MRPWPLLTHTPGLSHADSYFTVGFIIIPVIADEHRTQLGRQRCLLCLVRFMRTETCRIILGGGRPFRLTFCELDGLRHMKQPAK